MQQYMYWQLLTTMFIYFIFKWRRAIPEDMELIQQN